MAGIHFSAGTVGVFTAACRVPLGSIEAPMQCVQEVLCEEIKVKNFHCISINRLTHSVEQSCCQQIDLQLIDKCPTCNANRRLTMVTRARQCSYCKRDEPSWHLPSYFSKNNFNFIFMGPCVVNQI
jgi:hypothetical protein